MKRFLRALLIAAAAVGLGGVARAASVAASVEVELAGLIADGSEIDGAITIGYAPHGTTNAVVTINGEKFVDASEAGSKTWTPTKGGEYALKHAVGDIALEATYTVLSHDLDIDDGNNGEGGENSRFSYSGIYDGQGHGISVEVGEEIANPTIAYSLNKAGPYCESVLITNACAATPVWYTIEVAGYNTYTNWAAVTISPRPVTITSGTKTDFVYDGTAHGFPVIAISGNGFVVGEGIVTSNWATVTTVAQGEVANTFDYAAAEGTDLSNYAITVVTGKIAVVKAKVGPTGGDEPGSGEIGEDGLSKFDTVVVYDGEGHTIKTNELSAAFAEAMGEASNETKIWFARGGSANGFQISDFTFQSVGDAAEGESSAAVAPSEGWSLIAPEFTNVCEEVVWHKITNPNYEDYVHAAKVTITNREIVVTVVGKKASFVYDTTEKSVAGYEVATEDELYQIERDTQFRGAAIEFEGAGTGEGDASAAVGGTTALPKVVRTDVGTTAMGLKESDFANTNANFKVTYEVVDGSLEVKSREIGDDAANWDIRMGEALKYNGSEQGVPLIQVAFRKPDGNLVEIPYTLANDKATDAGNYRVKITGTGNYAGTVEKEWSIVERNITLTSATTSWVYDGTAHCASNIVVSGDGFVSGEGVVASGFPEVRHVADAAEPVANEFAYAFADGTKAKNYSVKTVFGTVQMAKRGVMITSPTKKKPYDGTALTFGAEEVVVAVSGDGGVIDSALPQAEAFAFSGFASITEAGQCAATFEVADGTALMDDYAITKSEGRLTVLKSATEITVTAKSGSWVYDGTAHTLHEYEATNLNTLLAGDALEVTFDEASEVTTPLDGANGDGVVANTITSVKVVRNGAADVTANYTLAAYPGTLTVTKRPVTLTSASAEKTFDGTPLVAHAMTVGGDKFVGEDGATATYSGTQTDVGSSKNAFAYALTAGTNAAYYDITKVEGVLKVNAADLADGEDGDWAVELGASLTYNGLLQIQTVAKATYKGLVVDCSVSDNQQTDAGAYQLTLTGRGNFAGTRKVDWRIAPKALTLVAGSGEKVYDGTPLTVGDVTATGFVAGEGATYVCAGEQTDVGTSENEVETINWNENTKGTNYAVTKTAGTLKVTPRAVTVTSKNIEKPYDGTPLALTEEKIVVTLTGTTDAAGGGTPALPSGESFEYSNFASRTEAGQTRGTFSIAAGAGTKLTNYAITTQYGMITITKSATEIGVTAASQSWVYDGEAHSNRTWTATNLNTLQSGDALEVTFDEASVVTAPTDGANGDGVVANVITAVKVIRNGATDVTANYTVTAYPGTLTVTRRPVTVTVVGQTATHVYDGEEKTAAGYEIGTEDVLYEIEEDTTFRGGKIVGEFGGGRGATALPEIARTDAGKTEMGLKAGDFANGNANFDVTFAVTDGSLTIEAADISTNDGADCVIALGENPLYNGTVQTIGVTAITYKGLAVTADLTGQNATDAGTYTLTVKGKGNFTGEKSTTWEIRKRAVTLTSASDSKAYDGTPLVAKTVTVGGDGFVAGEGATFDVTGSQTVAGSSANAFTYELKAGTKSANYDITKVEGTLTVTKAKFPGQEPGGAGIAWSVAADAATWVYDGKEHGVALTGVPSGVTANVVGNCAKDAGTYVASVTFEYDAANYEAPVAPAPITWTITRRPLSLQTVNAEKPYDGFPLTVERANITPGLSGYADGECFDYYDLASITEVGETAATFGYRDSATAKVSNYDVTVVGGATLKVTVGGDQISVTARDGTWAYDGEEHRLAAWDFVNADKLLAGHEFQIKIADDSVVTTPQDGEAGDGVVSNRFEYVRIVDTESGADKTRNYNLFVYEGRLQVTNADVRAEQVAGAEAVEKTYDGEAATVVVTADLLQEATVTYHAVTDDGEGGERWGEGRSEPFAFTHATNAVVGFVVRAEYYNEYTGRVAVAIAPRAITLKSPTKSKTYDGTALTFGAGEIGVAAGGGTPALPGNESLVFSGFATITDAGRVAATFEYAAGEGTEIGDYEVTTEFGTLTVLASADEITVTAASGTWAYDATEHRLWEFEATNEDKLQAGDELVVTFDAASVALTPEDGPRRDGVVSNVITSVRVVRGGETDVTANYSLAWYPGTLTVTKALVTFDGEGSVDPATFAATATYDGAGHAANVVAPTLLTSPVAVRYGRVADAVTLAEPPAFTNAGVHTAFYSISAPYYETYYGSTTVTIAPREVTLVSASATKVYDGTPLRADAVSVKDGSPGFVAGEGVEASCTSSQTGVGRIENGFNYEFRAGTLSDNYTVVPEFGWLEVTPGRLTVDVAASCYAGVYDGAAHGVSPVFDGTGLNRDACEVTYALVAGDESAYSAEAPTFANVGTYTVYVKVKAQNFEVAYAEATVTITKAEVEVPTLASKSYNGEVQTADVPESNLYTVYSNDGGKDVGEHPVMLRLRDAKNYKWAAKDGVTVAGSFASLAFRITREGNEWTTEPSIASWRTDEQAREPVAAAKYGEVTVTYKGTLASGGAYESAFSPMNPGSYVACFSVKESEDYDGLYREVPFTVTEKTVEPINVKATGYLGLYDGKGHSIALTVTGGSGTPTITYAEAEGGPYSATNPAYVEVGVHTTWYRVEFPNFAPIQGSAVVSISKGADGGGDAKTHTETTGEPVPYTWLEPYLAKYGAGDYEAAGNATGANGVALWESYVAGLDPDDATSQFRAYISVDSAGVATVAWNPDLSNDATPRVYTMFGKADLRDAAWTVVTDANKAKMRFFKVEVKMK